jgi:uncharacterized protein (DUF433 family)
MSEIVTTDGVLSGDPRIDGTRIGVIHVAGRVLDDEESPAVVAADYDLSLADVHRALAYYYDHPDEMQRIRREERAAIERIHEQEPRIVEP